MQYMHALNIVTLWGYYDHHNWDSDTKLKNTYM